MKATARLPQVISVGARGPLGLNSSQIAMCTRAGKLEPRSCHLRDRNGLRVGICSTVGIGPAVYGFDRFVELGAPAWLEAAATARPEQPLPMMLALPEPGRPDDDARFGPALIAALATETGVPIDIERSSVFRAGHAAGAMALQAAAALLNDRTAAVPAVWVGGIDSYYHPATIAWLDREFRLHSLDTEDGIIPSEGAAFALVAREAGSARSALPPPLTSLAGVLTGMEETVLSDEPNLACTMTEIVHRLTEAPGMSPIAWVLTDLNGERHRLSEWQKVEMRSTFAEEFVHDRLIDDLGDLGAATGPTLLAIACTYWRTGCAPARSVLVALHSEGPERGAFVLEAVQ